MGAAKKNTKEKRIVANAVRGAGLTRNGRTRNPSEMITRRKIRRFTAGNGTRPVSYKTAARQRLLFVAPTSTIATINDTPNVSREYTAVIFIETKLVFYLRLRGKKLPSRETGNDTDTINSCYISIPARCMYAYSVSQCQFR